MSEVSFTLRDARPADVPAIVSLIRDLAAYERQPEDCHADSRLLKEHLFGAKRFAEVVLAERAGETVGFALFFHNYSTFLTKPGIYLEDLFVLPAYRGKGIGKALLQHLAALAVKEGWTRFVWQVLDWNTPAIEFYEAHGAKVMRPWLTCRVEGEALNRLAREVD